MKKYQFPLQAILTLRAMKQEQALEVYARNVQECAARRSKVISATRRADDLEGVLSQKEGAVFSASMRGAYLRALDASREDVVRCQKSLDEAEKEKEKSLSEYLDRKRKKEILEHLRDKQMQAHLTEAYRKEEVEIEDLVISRAGISRIAS